MFVQLKHTFSLTYTLRVPASSLGNCTQDSETVDSQIHYNVILKEYD